MFKILLSFVLLLFIVVPSYAGWQQYPVNQPFLYKFASLPAVTNTVKTGPGILHAITVTGGTTSPIDIYDGTPKASALIYSFTTTNTLQTYPMDIGFSSGCTVVTNGAALRYTVSYL